MNRSNADTPRSSAAAPPWRKPRVAGLAALLAAFAIGAGTVAVALRDRPVAVVALTPAPINAMRDWSPVAVKGTVAEVFGNKFIVADDTGRALVDTGRDGEGAALVTAAETVTVQGRFERGFVRAASIAHADGRSNLVGPLGPPPHRSPPSWRVGERLTRWFARHPAHSG